MAKEGSTLSGFMDGVALSISIGLQVWCAAESFRGQADEHTF